MTSPSVDTQLVLNKTEASEAELWKDMNSLMLDNFTQRQSEGSEIAL